MNLFEPRSSWKSGIQTTHLKSVVKSLCHYEKSVKSREVPQDGEPSPPAAPNDDGASFHSWREGHIFWQKEKGDSSILFSPF